MSAIPRTQSICILHFKIDLRTHQNSPHQLTDTGDFGCVRCAIYRVYSVHQNSGFYNEQTGWTLFLSAIKESATLFKWVQKPTLNSNDSLTGLQANLFKIIAFCLFMAVPATITSEHCRAGFKDYQKCLYGQTVAALFLIP